MLGTFLYAATTLVLADDTNVSAAGRIPFKWEEWSTTGIVTTTPLYGAAVPSKISYGNLDRKLGFRSSQSFLVVGGSYAAAIAAQTAWLKSLDAAVSQTGTLNLQPDANQAPTLVFANCILKSFTLVPGPESTTGVLSTISFKFEPLTLS